MGNLTKALLLVDPHVHTRDFDQKYKGVFETETLALLTGGVGTAVTMPNTQPPLLTTAAVIRAKVKARGQIYCNLGFYLGSDGENLTEFLAAAPLVCGLKLFLNPTTVSSGMLLNPQDDPEVIERIFQAWTAPKPILVHAEGAELISWLIKLAARHRRQLHICHVSRAEELAVIQAAKGRGSAVTCETCPHYLAFTQDDLSSLGPYGIMKPPLGTVKDREALWLAILDETIDLIASDHAPHAPEEKQAENPAFGVIAEPYFPVLWKLFSERGLLLERLFELTRENPARIFDLQLSGWSFMEVDLDEEFTFRRGMIRSKAGRSPYEGMTVRGRIRSITLGGVEVIRDGEVLDERKGQVI